uniref:Transmembrane protein n=1 Tax=Tanacetum cinerariifolium TaxID=118510 RepID=A0A699TR02_TANCI|nr:hypothetical protein [Tanacetum cinerariifolium]
MLSLSDLIFSGGGGNDEGSAIANLVIHASADGDRRVWIVNRILLRVILILLWIGVINVACNRAVGEASVGRG